MDGRYLVGRRERSDVLVEPIAFVGTKRWQMVEVPQRSPGFREARQPERSLVRDPRSRP